MSAIRDHKSRFAVLLLESNTSAKKNYLKKGFFVNKKERTEVEPIKNKAPYKILAH